MLRGLSRGDRGLQVVQRVTGGYKRLLLVTAGYKRLQQVKRG